MKAAELLIKRINKIIVETSGINDKLDWEVYDIANEIIRKIKNGNKTIENNLTCINGEIKRKLFDKDFFISYGAIYFNNNEEYVSYIKKYGTFNCGQVSINGKIFMTLYLIIIDGKYDFNDFYDSVYHEFDHAFEESMLGKEFGGDDLNGFIRTNIYSQNIYKKVVAECLYATRTNEQDAMVNGMWGQVRYNIENDNNFNGEIDKYIIESEASIWLKKLYKNFQFIIKNKDNPELMLIIQYCKKNFNIGYGRLLGIMKGGIKRFEKKIAMVTRRCKQRFIKEYHVHKQINSKQLIDEGKSFYCLRTIYI